MYPFEWPVSEPPPGGGSLRSTTGPCDLCERFQIVTFEMFDGRRVGFCCIQDAMATAEARHLMAGLHRVMGCPETPCKVCER